MLHQFLSQNRGELISRCSAKVAKRAAPLGIVPLQENGIPVFLDQLIETLEIEQIKGGSEGNEVSGPSEPTPAPVASAIGRTAARHGAELLRQGLTVDQVVHDYGDLCQAVTELAEEMCQPVTVPEFHTLNRCLDNAIADAVTEFGRQRDGHLLGGAGERLGNVAHEMRKLLDTAALAFNAIRRGKVGLSGATGDVLNRSLTGLRDVIDRSLTEVRLAERETPPLERLMVADLIEQAQVAAALNAADLGCALTILPCEAGLIVLADRHMILSAIANLLNNACKFTRAHTHVSLAVRSTTDRVLIDVSDECGGLPPTAADELFRPFDQRQVNQSGLGAGLSISRRSVQVCGGELSVRDRPGIGCVFTISLPRA